MAVRLSVLTAGLDPAPSVLIKGRRATLGRGADAHVRIPDPSVSQHHATIMKRGDSYLLMDEGSRFGTAAGPHGAPVWLAPESPRVLADGEHILLGQIELLVEFVVPERGAATGMEELAHTLVRAGLSAAGYDATDDLVEQTLRELTELDDQDLAPADQPIALPSPVGVADLASDDRNPPWKTDLFVALIALAITAGCLALVLRLGAS